MLALALLQLDPALLSDAKSAIPCLQALFDQVKLPYPGRFPSLPSARDVVWKSADPKYADLVQRLKTAVGAQKTRFTSLVSLLHHVATRFDSLFIL